jgi:hypothetical protein
MQYENEKKLKSHILHDSTSSGERKDEDLANDDDLQNGVTRDGVTAPAREQPYHYSTFHFQHENWNYLLY